MAAARKALYDEVARQATLAESGGLAKERSVLLLWFLRNVVGVEELEAYDHVCDGDNDKGIDGLFVEQGTGDTDAGTLVIYQSKYTQSASGEVGPTDIDRLAGAANYFVDSSTLASLLASGPEQKLRDLIKRLGLERLFEGSQPPEVRLVLVTTGKLNGDAQKKVKALQRKHGQDYFDLWDLTRLGPLAKAVKAPERLKKTVSISVKKSQTLIVGKKPKRVAIVPVSAREIATSWPDIDSRRLFALNVRHELRANKVSRALDGAISRTQEHPDFVAYHNGLTVVCDEFTVKAGGAIDVKYPSVVNGAQSVLAFVRAEAEGTLTDDLKVFMKIVEVKGRPLLEKEVARRSNTQTGVNPRNLMANHGTQLRLQREFENDYPGTLYETRPDTVEHGYSSVIKNDEAAQLLCAIYNEWPWLAVKKNTLFEGQHHPQIFSERIHAHHIVFADKVKEAVQQAKDEFPEAYRESWLLTRLVACYLVGQLLRTAKIVSDPLAASRADLEAAVSELPTLAGLAGVSLAERHEGRGESDDFKSAFKNEKQLLEMAAEARKVYKLSDKLAKQRTKS